MYDYFICHSKSKSLFSMSTLSSNMETSLFQVIGNVNRQVQDYHVQCPYCHTIQNIKLSKKK